MKLAFYKVENSMNYERHTFDMWCDRPQVIMDMLSKLQDDELRLYDMDYDMDIFQEDFNDEEFDDGCWWSLVIHD